MAEILPQTKERPPNKHGRRKTDGSTKSNLMTIEYYSRWYLEAIPNAHANNPRININISFNSTAINGRICIEPQSLHIKV